MAKKVNSPTSSFTEFAPLSPEQETKSFSFWNFFKKQGAAEKDNCNVESSQLIRNEPDKEHEMQNSSFSSDVDISDFMNPLCSSEIGSDNIGSFQNRNMNSVLQIVRNMVDGRKVQSYKDSDFKQYWMPDSNCKECYECGDKFTTFRRRHHCRVCGQIFCRRCCNQGIPGKLIGYSGDLRVCTYCYKMVSSCIQSIDSNSELPKDLQSFHDDIKQNLSLDTDRASISSNSLANRRKSSVVGFREEDIARAKPSILCDFHCDTEYGRNLTLESSSSTLDPTSMGDLYKQLIHPGSGAVLKKTETNLHNFDTYIHGYDIVDWLLAQNSLLSRSQAVNIGQYFLDVNLMDCEVTDEKKFIDGNMVYKLKMMDEKHTESASSTDSAENQESMEPLWVKEIQNAGSDLRSGLEESEEFCISASKDVKVESRSRIPSSSSSFYLDLDLKESTVKVSRPIFQEEQKHVDAPNFSFSEKQNEICQDRTVNLDIKYLNEGMHNVFSENVLKVFNANISKSSQDSQNMQQLKDECDSKTAFEELNLAFKNLAINLLRQLLESDGLSSSWCEVILPIVHHVTEMVHPDVKNEADSMDIRQYVQFKKIPGGSKNECMIISGVVFSKTVAHRKMKQNVQQPTLLLLSSPISYQRTENKLTSLDPVLMQEFEYLKNTIGKLSVCKPDVLFVEKSVSRLAQEMLLLFGITVALNVKSSVMERVARCTQAAIVSTVDAHLSKPQLGTCEEFKVKTYIIPGGKAKTLMFLDGCPGNLGCTILLRGGSSNELKKVKQKVQFMLYVVYNWKLERSFLMDEYALPPCILYDGLLDSFDNTVKKDASLATETVENKPTELSLVNKWNVKNTEFYSNSTSHGSLEGGSNNKIKTKTDDTSRKLETKCIDDFSDPLHSYLRSENDIVFIDSNDLQVSTLPVSNTFRKLLDDIILCCSLNVKIKLPYLETEIGKKNPLRKYFPAEIYWSVHFTKESESKLLNTAQVNFDEENEFTEMQIHSGNVEIRPRHDFTLYKIIDVSTKALDLHMRLADFRARGCTIKYLCPHQYSLKGKEKKIVSSLPSNVKEAPKPTETTSAGLCWERKVDALDPVNHQKLAVLFCSYSCTSNNAPNYCVNPWVVKMDFYGCNDISFGGFLERYCFRSSYVCPSTTCDTPMTEHVRKFVHGSGCVHILLHELSSGVCRIQQSAENNILMWSWCHKCKQASPVVPMSQDTWSFSFAKYLELRFYADTYTRQRTQGLCCHSLHHDHYQYFAHKQVVAIFQYSPIVIWEVALPSLIIPVKDEAIPLSSVVEEIKTLAVKGCEIYNTVVEKLSAFKHQYLGTNSESIINNLLATQKVEHSEFRAKIEQIQLRVTSPTLENMHLDTELVSDKNYNKGICSFMWKVEDQVTSLKYYIEESVHLWNCRIQDFISYRRKEEKQPLKPALSNKAEDPILNTSVENLGNEEYSENVVKPDVKSHINHTTERKDIWKERAVSLERFPQIVKDTHAAHGLIKACSVPKNLVYTGQNLNEKQEIYDGADNHSISSSGSSYTYGVTPGIYAGLMVPEPEDDESYVVCHKEQCHGQLSTDPVEKGHERSVSEGHQCISNSVPKVIHDKAEEGVKQDKKERTVRTLLSQFLSNSEITCLQSPFPPMQHIIMESEQDKIPIIVYDEEPSSIIAYTLASAEYEQQLQELRVNITSTLGAPQTRDSQSPSPLLKKRQNSKVQAEVPTDSDSLQLPADDVSNDFLDKTLYNSQEIDKGHKSANRMTNLEIQFSDNNAKFYCRVYYAEQFRKLRCLVFNEGEERFIRSLSHCIPWEARGGKSGSTFCKTRDDRFILKQMQKLELQSFLNFAPSYFYYLNKACLEQKPTLLAKIVGVYRIGFKNNATNTASKMDLLVMENLFYDRNITRKYDLKGSIRNRLVNTSGLQEDDIVLLDENLLKITCDNPLYIRPHSKTVLSLAIDNDTQFLSEQEVMDYSLLVGLDEEKMELVVGIIDYVRTFTWGKRVEMIVKSSGILGGHGKMPTVVSPELYRMRFREAMDGYFLWVPDRWTGKDNNCGLFK